MQYITVKDLKKQAKKERKINLNLKNHSESLNYISNKYNFKSWEDLLDNTVLQLNNSNENIHDELNNADEINSDQQAQYLIFLLNGIIKNIYNNLHSFHEILQSSSQNVLTNYIHRTFNNFKDNDGSFSSRGIDLIHIMSFLFYETNDEKKYVFDNFYKYLNFDTITEEIFKNKNIDNSQIINDFLDNTLIAYIRPTPSNPKPEQCEATHEQFGYLTCQYSRNFNVIKNTLKVFSNVNITRKEIIELLKTKENLHLLYNNQLLDKDNLFLNYTKQLTGNEYSVYNKSILDKHIKLLESL